MTTPPFGAFTIELPPTSTGVDGCGAGVCKTAPAVLGKAYVLPPIATLVGPAEITWPEIVA